MGHIQCWMLGVGAWKADWAEHMELGTGWSVRPGYRSGWCGAHSLHFRSQLLFLGAAVCVVCRLEATLTLWMCPSCGPPTREGGWSGQQPSMAWPVSGFVTCRVFSVLSLFSRP